VRTRCRFVSTVFSETVGLSYRKPAAKTTEGTRGTLPKKQKKLTSSVAHELRERAIPGAYIVKTAPQQDWSGLRASSREQEAHLTSEEKAAAARVWVTEESRRLRSEAGAYQRWQGEKTLRVLHSLLYEE